MGFLRRLRTWFDRQLRPRPAAPAEASDGLRFAPELFDARARLMERLSTAGYEWLSHYGSIDVIHDQYGLEIGGIHREDDANAIAHLVATEFPQWRWRRIRHIGENTREPGFIVEICRDPPRPAGLGVG